MRTIKNIAYTEADIERQKLDLYLPTNKKFPIFIYFHGGGLEDGSKENQPFVPSLTENGIAVACANYRMYPEAKFPDFIIDAASVVAWVKNNIKGYGECTGIFVGGSSAGGYLTQMLCFDKKYLAKHNINADDISGYFMDAGQPTSHFNVLREKGLDTRRVIIDETAPLYFIESGRAYPPMKILVSDNDMTNRLEQTQLLLSTLKHFENDMSKVDFEIIKNSQHCEYIDKTKDGKNVFAEMIIKFINKYGGN